MAMAELISFRDQMLAPIGVSNYVTELDLRQRGLDPVSPELPFSMYFEYELETRAITFAWCDSSTFTTPVMSRIVLELSMPHT